MVGIEKRIEKNEIDTLDVALIRGLTAMDHTVVSNKTNPLYVRLSKLADEGIVDKYERQDYSTRFSVNAHLAAYKLLDIIDNNSNLIQKYSVGIFDTVSILLEHMETNDKLMSDIAFLLNKKLLRTGYNKREDQIDFHVLE